jgi:single-strand DNA-binding protein
MSSSLNQVQIIGNLGKDPEMRYLPNGNAVTSFSVATTETWKDKEGNKQEKTEWHNVKMFGKLAEVAGEYLKKGGQVFVQGRLETDKWTDKEGRDRYTMQIIASDMKMLGLSKNAPPHQVAAPKQELGLSQAEQQKAANRAVLRKMQNQVPEMADDIPF